VCVWGIILIIMRNLFLATVCSISCSALRLKQMNIPEWHDQRNVDPAIEFFNPHRPEILEVVAHNNATGHLLVRGNHHILFHGPEKLRSKIITLMQQNSIPFTSKIKFPLAQENFQVRLISLIQDLPALPKGFIGLYDDVQMPQPINGKQCLRDSNFGNAYNDDGLHDIPKLATRIHQEMQDSSIMQTVIVAFCLVGCDQTGMLVTSYKMKFEGSDLKSSYEENTKTCGRGMIPCYHTALERMCSLQSHSDPEPCRTGAKCRNMTEKETNEFFPKSDQPEVCDYNESEQ